MPEPVADPLVLALVPARGGSKGLPGKNLMPLAGHPLVAHAIHFGKSLSFVRSTLCSTDDSAIQKIALKYGAETPELRPQELALDTTPMLPVMKHALQTAREHLGFGPSHLLLLDPTSPVRKKQDAHDMMSRLLQSPEADGIVTASIMEPNPIWYGVVEKDGYMQDLVPEGKSYTRRQDVPPVFKINGLLYIWTAEFIDQTNNWREGNLLLHPTSTAEDHNIDTLQDFERLQADLDSGKISLDLCTP